MASTLDNSQVAAAKLPLWRVVSGIGVLGILASLLVMAGSVYADNFVLDRYMRNLAAAPSSVAASDAELTRLIVQEAEGLGLAVHTSDVTVTREGGKPRIRIAKYSVQTKLVRMDLRLPEASSR